MSKLGDTYTYKITLLRHAESVGNVEHIYQGRTNFDLSEKGRAQSQALASRWLEEGTTFDRIISSPQSRARQTAEIITESLSAPLEFNSDWIEIDNGSLAGLTSADAAERYPFPDFMTPYDQIGETGESNWDLYLRAGRAVQDLILRSPGRYLVVSHGGILNRVMYTILGIVPQVNFAGARFRFGNSAFAIVDYDPSRHIWRVDRMNDRSHWPEARGSQN
jgi:2,3-bisphosphoglycerate-dependent phosphoglycerate mutase